MSIYRQVGKLLPLCAVLLLLGGCSAGSKLLKEPLPMVAELPLVVAGDERIAATLDWVIVPGGPGTWAKNARWDEYLISVKAASISPVEISEIRIVDAFDLPQPSYADRKSLFSATKTTDKRYRAAGFDPKPGEGMDTMMKVGTGAAAAGAMAGAAIGGMLTTLGASGSAVAAGAAGGALVFGGPLLAVGGIIRASRHEKVDAEIAQRQTLLPVVLTAGEPMQLRVFVPITPSPQRLEIDYQVDAQAHTLAMDLDAVLGSLHLPDVAADSQPETP